MLLLFVRAQTCGQKILSHPQAARKARIVIAFQSQSRAAILAYSSTHGERDWQTDIIIL